jgi:hypothetical protein
MNYKVYLEQQRIKMNEKLRDLINKKKDNTIHHPAIAKYLVTKYRLDVIEEFLDFVEGETVFSFGRLPRLDITDRIDFVCKGPLMMSNFTSPRRLFEKFINPITENHKAKLRSGYSDQSYYRRMLEIFCNIDAEKLEKEMRKRFEVLAKRLACEAA